MYKIQFQLLYYESTYEFHALDFSPRQNRISAVLYHKQIVDVAQNRLRH